MDESNKKQTMKWTHCRLCGNEIPMSSPFRFQGYCACAQGATRYGGMKDLTTLTQPKVDDAVVNNNNITNTSENTVKKPRNPNRITAFTLYCKDMRENGSTLDDAALLSQWKECSKEDKRKYYVLSNPNSQSKQTIDTSNLKCFRCNYTGHISKDCTTVICEFCKGRNHTKDVCFKNPDNACKKCNDSGHKTENCRRRFCDVCNKIGHATEDCWTNMKCEVCEKTGHPTSYCSQRCDKCNRRGHTAEDCRSKKNYNNENRRERPRVARKCWLCKDDDADHSPKYCPEQRNMTCGDCGEDGHHTKFCENMYIFRR